MSADRAASVVVVGSIHLDSTLRVNALPRPGETVLVGERTQRLGGKGANQAVAAARNGAEVQMVGLVGPDAAGELVRTRLETLGVDIALTGTGVEGTGCAIVVVDEHGENLILVEGGSDAEFDADHVDAAGAAIRAASVLVVQAEASRAATRRAVEIALESGVRIVANLAPFDPGYGFLAAADPLVVNAGEAGALIGTGPLDAETVIEHAGILGTEARSLVVTLGADGCVVIDTDGVRRIAAPRAAAVVDTTGAGDAFVGALAASLAAGHALDPAAARANRYAARTVEHHGAADSYPEAGDADVAPDSRMARTHA